VSDINVIVQILVFFARYNRVIRNVMLNDVTSKIKNKRIHKQSVIFQHFV